MTRIFYFAMSLSFLACQTSEVGRNDLGGGAIGNALKTICHDIHGFCFQYNPDTAEFTDVSQATVSEAGVFEFSEVRGRSVWQGGNGDWNLSSKDLGRISHGNLFQIADGRNVIAHDTVDIRFQVANSDFDTSVFWTQMRNLQFPTPTYYLYPLTEWNTDPNHVSKLVALWNGVMAYIYVDVYPLPSGEKLVMTTIFYCFVGDLYPFVTLSRTIKGVHIAASQSLSITNLMARIFHSRISSVLSDIVNSLSFPH